MVDNFITLPTVKQGDTWTFVFTFKNKTTPIDLTECSARMQIRNKRTTQLYAETSTANDTITIDGLAGKVSVVFPAELTTLVPAGSHLSDVEITFPGTGYVMSSQTVQIVVEEDITE